MSPNICCAKLLPFSIESMVSNCFFVVVFWLVFLTFYYKVVANNQVFVLCKLWVTLLFPSMIVIEIVLFLGTEPRQPINTGAQAHPTAADPAIPHQEQPVTKGCWCMGWQCTWCFGRLSTLPTLFNGSLYHCQWGDQDTGIMCPWYN